MNEPLPGGVNASGRRRRAGRHKARRTASRIRVGARADGLRVVQRIRQLTGRYRYIWRYARFGLTLLLGIVVGLAAARWYYARRGASPVVALNGVGYSRDRLNYDMSVAAGHTLVRSFLSHELRRQFARSRGVYPSEEDVEDRLDQEQRRPNFALRLLTSGQSMAEFRDQLRLSLAEFRYITRGVAASDEEIRAYYEADIEEGAQGSQFRIPETAVLAAIQCRTRAEARSVLDELKAGESWESVARRRSIDASAKYGGLQPPMARGRFRSAYGADIEKMVFRSMSAGQIVGPVVVGPTWWLLQLREVQRPRVIPFAEARDDARMAVMLAKAGPAGHRRLQADFREFARRARIQAFSPEYASFSQAK